MRFFCAFNSGFLTLGIFVLLVREPKDLPSFWGLVLMLLGLVLSLWASWAYADEDAEDTIDCDFEKVVSVNRTTDHSVELVFDSAQPASALHSDLLQAVAEAKGEEPE